MTRRRLARELRWLRAYVLCSALAFVFLFATTFRPRTERRNLGEITVERINVVDANGTLRLVISDKDRMHPGVIDGHPLTRPRPYAGLLFFNDQGDEVGGLITTGLEQGSERHADAGLTFDQLKQDQIIGIGYEEANRSRTAALRVWDRPEASILPRVDGMNAAMAIADPAARQAAIRAVNAAHPSGVRRLFVGKSDDKSVSVTLSDAVGRVRASLKVDAAGNAALEFLDENGQIIDRLPRAKP